MQNISIVQNGILKINWLINYSTNIASKVLPWYSFEYVLFLGYHLNANYVPI
jgi:hypothetical protein